jgi:hypothetical protein
MLNHDVHAPAAPATITVPGGTLTRVLVAVIVILLAATLGLAAAFVAPAMTTSPGEAFADEMIAAWNTRDIDRIREIYTEEAFVWQSASTAPKATGIDEIVDLVRYGGLTVERIGPIVERGNLRTYPIHVSNTYDIQGDDAMAILAMEDGRIAQHWVIWD